VVFDNCTHNTPPNRQNKATAIIAALSGVSVRMLKNRRNGAVLLWRKAFRCGIIYLVLETKELIVKPLRYPHTKRLFIVRWFHGGLVSRCKLFVFIVVYPRSSS
ncbi:MAG: hypothetical protein Q8S55_14345, partial [Methylococcaceae bacterium]|nr:hypothetical protein [Methylococcaceae bacterium]